ncbi:MAG: NAD(P)-dependent alcohol dehydrogenase [Ignavibacteriaceae bacterium]
MKAAVFSKYGPPEVVQVKDVPKPEPGDNEIIIKVYAATVNRTDCGFRKPEPWFVRFFSGVVKPKMKILGNEFSGVVDETGKAVKLFKKGDHVFGLTGGTKFGAHAEYLCLPEDFPIVLKPESLSFEEAASACDGGMLALTCLSKIDFDKNHKILINGTTGSIGSAALQIAKKHYGAEITAVCNTKNIELVKSLGADRIIDYLKEDFTKDNEVYDVVFDAVGKSSFPRCKKLIKDGGLYISTDLGYFYQTVFHMLWTSKFGTKKAIIPFPKETKQLVIFIKELLEQGMFKPVIDRCYPLEQIVEAYRYVDTGEKTGNVVIQIAHQ